MITLWTDLSPEQKRAAVAPLWAEGITAAQIARQLGCSKNSVVSVAHRWDLETRASPIRPPSTTPRPPRMMRKRPTLVALVAPSQPAPPPTLPPPPTASTCQWPMNDGYPWRFCGCSHVVAGRPYCAPHVARAYSWWGVADAR